MRIVDPEPLYASRYLLARGAALEGDLKRGEHVVGVVAEKDGDADRRGSPTTAAAPSMAHTARLCLPLKYVAGDAPELTSPLGRPPDQTRATQQARRGDRERLHTHTVELTSSWLQSIDDLNVPVFIL